MATTTPNFGWPVPTSTDLVKDGATAIEALGDGIDASLVDLRGGTTGQILAKATNTDMDFAWITNDVGDITAVTAGTGITGGGTSGAVTVSFDQANFGGGQFAAGKNKVINGDMNIWQRGTSIAVSGLSAYTYTTDRFFLFRQSFSTGATVSRQTTSDTTNLPFIQYCSRVQRDSGNTSTNIIYFGQDWESGTSIPFAGKTVTISYYARKGANYSGTNYAVSLLSGTGTNQRILDGYTGAATVATSTPTLTTTWTRFTATGTVASTATQIGIITSYTPVGTAGAADFVEITGVQVEAGSVATPFQTSTGTIQGELAACQRYAYSHVNGNGQMVGNVYAFNSTQLEGVVEFPVTMRIAPTLTASSGASYFATRYGGFTTSTVTIFNASTTAALLYAAVTGATTGDGNALNSNASQASILFVSEL